jgi:1A family penicillin-binding protein
MRQMRYFILCCLAAGSAAGQGTGEPWQITQPVQSSLVFARDGSLIGDVGHQSRTSVTITSLPRYVPLAFIAREDQRFYEHNGVDLKSVAGAIKDNVMGEHRGASTIDQQLVGMMHPDIIDRSQVSGIAGMKRKVREQNAAREMEKHYSKQQILEAYLNQVDLGHQWFGVESAAHHYFGVSAAQLSLAQAASLAALPKSPPAYDPIRHPDQNKRNRNLILDLMVDQKLISAAEAERAKLEPVTTAPNNGVAAPSNYFVDAVKTEAERAGIPIMNGGYRVYTTLDIPMQVADVNALVAGTASVEARPEFKHMKMAEAKNGETDYLQGMVIVLDPYDGDVRALVGGRNYAMAPFNRATTAYRQPGSSIKPIVFAKALEEGIPINRIYSDTLLEIPLDNGQIYTPGEIDNRFLGPMTLREALVKSRNTVAVQVGIDAGMDSVAALAKRMGIESRMLPVPSSAIGASVVHPIELAAAYSAFVNNGQVIEPRMITRIADLHGRTVLATQASVPQQVLDPRAAFILRDVMREVTERGSGTAARRAVPARVPIAGKTGTSNDNNDVWFLGMTPDFVGAVWLGFDKLSTITTSAVGGALAAPIWGQMMGTYYSTRSPREWPQAPAGLVFADVDRETGEPATPMTPGDRRQIEYFIAGTEPYDIRSPWNVPRWGPVMSSCFNVGFGCF